MIPCKIIIPNDRYVKYLYLPNDPYVKYLYLTIPM